MTSETRRETNPMSSIDEQLNDLWVEKNQTLKNKPAQEKSKHVSFVETPGWVYLTYIQGKGYTVKPIHFWHTTHEGTILPSDTIDAYPDLESQQAQDLARIIAHKEELYRKVCRKNASWNTIIGAQRAMGVTNKDRSLR